MALIEPVASFKTFLTKALTSSGTEMFIDSVTDDAGNSLDGLELAFVIDKGTSKEETVIGTVDASNKKVTSLTRGVDPQDGSTEVSSLKVAHDASTAEVEITSHPYLLLVCRMLNGKDNLGGVIQLPSSRTISNARDVVDKEYADNLTVATLNTFSTTDDGGLTINVGAGRILRGDGTIDYAGDSNYSLDDDATNYVELDPEGTLVHNTTGWTPGNLSISKVVTASGNISSIEDARGFLTVPADEDSIVYDQVAGESISEDDFVVLDTSDGKWYKADTTDFSTIDNPGGFAMSDASSDDNLPVQVSGVYDGLTGLSSGKYYVDNTAGQISQSIGSYKRVVGYAISSTQLVLLENLQPADLSGSNSSLTTSIFNEAMTFFGSTDITGAEAETLTDGSDASGLHTHPENSIATENLDNGWVVRRIDGANGGWSYQDNTNGISDGNYRRIRILPDDSQDEGVVASLYLGTSNISSNYAWDTDHVLGFIASFDEASADKDAFMGIGDNSMAPSNPTDGVATNQHVGFIVEDDKLYASNADGTTQTSTEITGTSIAAANSYRVEFTAASTIEFYVNGTLEATHSTNLPTGTSNFYLLFSSTDRSSSIGDADLYVACPVFFSVKLT